MCFCRGWGRGVISFRWWSVPSPNYIFPSHSLWVCAYYVRGVFQICSSCPMHVPLDLVCVDLCVESTEWNSFFFVFIYGSFLYSSKDTPNPSGSKSFKECCFSIKLGLVLCPVFLLLIRVKSQPITYWFQGRGKDLYLLSLLIFKSSHGDGPWTWNRLLGCIKPLTRVQDIYRESTLNRVWFF